MATNTCFFLVVLVCGAVCGPLGQQTIFDTQNRLPGLLPGLGTTAVCDATSNLLGSVGLGYGLGVNLQGAPSLNGLTSGIYDTLTNVGLNPFGHHGINSPYGPTSVCENASNLGLGLGVGLGGLGGLAGLGSIFPGPAPMYESIPNLGLGSLGYGGLGGLGVLGSIVPGSTNVCESTSNLGLGLGCGVPYLSNRAHPTTLSESVHNIGAGYPHGIPRLNNYGHGLGHGYPFRGGLTALGI